MTLEELIDAEIMLKTVQRDMGHTTVELFPIWLKVKEAREMLGQYIRSEVTK